MESADGKTCDRIRNCSRRVVLEIETVRSQHADEFNHDEDAAGYDADVSVETHPIRAGYSDVLSWVAASAEIKPSNTVLELGSGTGNLSILLPKCVRLVCVDVSENMESIALLKPVLAQHREFIKADVLEIFEKLPKFVDRVVSTYTLHHLMEPEKAIFLRKLWEHLPQGGVACIGDLMVATASEVEQKMKVYKATYPEVTNALKEEFFWHLDRQSNVAREVGFEIESRRFSDLSYGLKLVKG